MSNENFSGFGEHLGHHIENELGGKLNNFNMFVLTILGEKV